MTSNLRRLIAGFFVFSIISIGAIDAQQSDQAADAMEDAPAPAAATVDSFEAAKDPNTPIDELRQHLLPLNADQLAEIATSWQRNLQTTLEESVVLNIELKTASEGRAEEIRKELIELTEERSAEIESYRQVIAAWERKGASEDELSPHQSFISALATDVVRTTDLRTLVNLVIDWAIAFDGGAGLLLKAATFVFALWVMRFPAKFVRAQANRGLGRVRKMSKLLKNFILGTLYWLTFLVGIVMVLGLFGVPIAPLFAVFGGLSFILGFALQDTLGNIASGLMIMILKPFDHGDYVEIAGTAGYVDDMNVVSTRIRTFDNQFIIIPNSKIWGDVITNVDAADSRRVDLVFGIGYSDDTDLARKTLMELAQAHPKCLSEPEIKVFVGELGESSVNLYCRPWVRTEDYWDVYWDLTGHAKERFDELGISIPFPQRDVHVSGLDLRPDKEAELTGGA